jgi:cyclohexadieny/prephenate dehydrogenase
MKQLFKKITIIGLGLIGGSIGLALKRAGSTAQLIGAARSQKTLDVALERNLVERVEIDIVKSVEDADLVILATPLSSFKKIIFEVSHNLKPGCIVTDTGSSKLKVIEELSNVIPMGVSFIPGHPIAGTELSGPEAGFAELFDDRWCVLTPTEDTNKDALNSIRFFWEALGSKVEIMNPEHHDRVLAITSHIPHLIAYNIVGTANDLANVTNKEVVKYSAGGFRDFTRIAASDPKMWRDIFLYNDEAVLEMLSFFSKDLMKLKKAIEEKDSDLLQTFFENTREVRKNIIDAGQEVSDIDFGRLKK